MIEDKRLAETDNALKDAAVRWNAKNGLQVSELINRDIRDAFIAGAEWQARQLLKSSPLPEDTIIFQKGVEEGKRLMMKEAVEGEVENGTFGIVYLRKNLVNEGYSTGDKMKIIIVKQ